MNDRFKFRYVFEKDFGGKTGICYKMPVFNLDDAVRSVFENKIIEYTNFDYKLIAKNQCTGLKDKNGKLIYEGDIVEAKHKPDREGWYCVWRGVVEYDNQNCQYVIKASHYSVLNETKLNKAIFENNESFNWFDWLKVIGNIYEIKEPLEECE